MGISRREVQGNGRKQVIELCGGMKEKGTEATRTRALVEVGEGKTLGEKHSHREKRLWGCREWEPKMSRAALST